MALDYNILLQGRQSQVPDILGMMQKSESIKRSRQERNLIDEQSKKDEKKRQTFAELYQKNDGDFTRIAQGMANSGYADEALKFTDIANKQKILKQQEEEYKANLEDKTLKRILPLMSQMSPEQRQEFARNAYSRTGLDISEIDEIGPIDDELYKSMTSHYGISGGKYAPEIVYGPGGEIYQASRQPGETKLSPYTLPSGDLATKFVKPELIQSGGGQYYVNPVSGKQNYVGPTGRPGQLIETDEGTLTLVPGTTTAVPVTQPSGEPVSKQKVTPEIKEKIRSKLNTVAIMRNQLQNVKDKFNAIKGSNISSQPLGGGLTKGGRAFDSAVDALRTTVRQLTRTPGEGSMSDWEGKLNMAQLPKREIYDDITQQQIDQLDELIKTIESGYSEYSKTGYIPEINKPKSAPNKKGQRRKATLEDF